MREDDDGAGKSYLRRERELAFIVRNPKLASKKSGRSGRGSTIVVGYTATETSMVRVQINDHGTLHEITKGMR